MRNRGSVLAIVIIFVVIGLFLLVPGFLSRQPDAGGSQFSPVKVHFPASVPVTEPADPHEAVNTTTMDIPVTTSARTSQSPIELTVHSAARYRTLPGWNNREGTVIAVINVSITNDKPTVLWLPRDNLVIRTNLPGSTLEHGGDRLSPEIAGNFLRFPLTIGPGETKTGSIVYIVKSGPPVNNLVLTDQDNVIQAIVDLNRYYNRS